MPQPTQDPFFGVGEKMTSTSVANHVLDDEVQPNPGLLASTIPPEHLFRTLVLCFDGTGDQFDVDNSNIVELFSMLKKDDRGYQLCYYQAGIGTYITPQVATPLMTKISKVLDEAIAWNLDAHVMDGYEFLMQNYKAGDRICLFGFSRGAYIARALAGMIHEVGLLPACNHQQVPFAYKMFKRVDKLGWKQSNVFKKAFSVDVKIEFLGVWDTVNAVGIISKRLPFTTSNTIVRTFRHAIALDECRSKFKANYFNHPTDEETHLGVESQKPEHSPRRVKRALKRATKKAHLQDTIERQYCEQEGRPTDTEEVWFTGCHCDVGGGSVENDTPHALARLSLRWMIRECFKTMTGIMFKTDGLLKVGIDPTSLYPTVKPRPPLLAIGKSHIQHTPSRPFWKTFTSKDTPTPTDIPLKAEEEHELLDALAPIYDQLHIKPLWWILEIIPQRQRYQLSNKTWEEKLQWNVGVGRYIPRQTSGTVKIHRSVKMRMDAKFEGSGKYKPGACFRKAKELGHIEWVD